MSTNLRRAMGSIALLSVLVAFAAGCGGSPAAHEAPSGSLRQKSHGGTMKVTTTTGMIADTAKNIGGEWVEVTGLMGPGVDPHLYKASQGDIQKLTEADLILYNGLHLEGKMIEVLEKLARTVSTVAVTDSIPQDSLRNPPEFQGQHDPHVWFDVGLWIHVAERIRDAMVAVDPAHKPEFEKNAAAYIEQLRQLDAYAREQIATIPKEQRVLVTAHDAFGYFGRAYDIEVKGLQGISTTAEFGTQDVARLAELIASRGIKAVFVESSVPQRSIEVLVNEVKSHDGSVTIGGQLFSDAMGEAGSPEGTYIGMVRYNIDTIVKALR
ncbi:MAG: zinc ABC transporter substrate-binding protein [Candidatus Hydrogenedentes bacterium]|nr:zinc ABC transporter substrate-binding protein [Candidatus Hydrogenedentota bacterium]